MLYFVAVLCCICQSAEAADSNTKPPQSLELLIERAILGHPDIAAAVAERRAAEFEVGVARNQFYPTPAVQLRKDKDATVTVASLTQPVWAGGRLMSGLDAAKSRAAAADLAIAEASYSLAARVIAAWAALRQAQGREDALAEGVDLLNAYTKSVNRRILGGASAEVDSELVASRVAQAQSDLAAARTAQRLAMAQLAQLLGQPSDTTILDPTNSDPAHTARSFSNDKLLPLDELIRHALDYSPTLRRFDSDIEAARFNVQRIRAVLWPTVNLRFEHQRSDATTSSTSTNDSRIMLTLDYTPEAGLAAGASIDAAQSRIVAHQERREAFRRELTEQVRGNYEEYLTSRDRARGIGRTLEANSAVLASYDRLLIAGKRGWLDVLNIARELTLARTSLVETHALLEASAFRLRLQTGQLLAATVQSPS